MNLQFRQLSVDAIAQDQAREYVRSVQRYGGTVAPFGYAGFVVDECAVLCNQCHDETIHSTDAPIFGDEEADYPGLICRDCGRLLDTRVLVYASGQVHRSLKNSVDNQTHECEYFRPR